MNQRIRALQELGVQFDSAVHASPRGASVPRRRLIATIVALAVLALAAVALAAGGVFSTGATVTPGFGDLTRPTSGGGVVVVGSVHPIVASAADPAGGPRWGIRVLRTSRGLSCIQVGRVVGGRLGVLGEDGAFGNDGRFHPLPAAVVESSVDCGTPDARGRLYLAFQSDGVPASAYELGCSPPGDVDPHPNPPICAARDERSLYAGLLGPFARSVTYVAPGGARRTIATGPGGAYMIVRVADPRRDQGGANLGGVLPSPGNAQPIRRISYANGVVCEISGLSERDADGHPCVPVGYRAPRLRTPAARLVAAHVGYRVRIDKPAPLDPGFREDGVEVTFRARVAVHDAQSGYVVDLGLPDSRPCRGGAMGTLTDRNIAAGQLLHVDLSFGAHPSARLGCPGRYVGRVYFVQSVRSGALAMGFPPPPGQPGTSRVLVGGFSFTVK